MALNMSRRSSSAVRSVIEKFLPKLISTVQEPGPRTRFLPTFRGRMVFPPLAPRGTA
jgi:hypothetical protein